MTDSEEENEHFCYFGKPLEPYDEDSFPKRRPVTVEEQIATDSQGRRRFHGAFTGGFSAGFFNTVGSLEGWKPSEFKSSRSEKAKEHDQKPQDFMDEEDLGEYGIAAQVVRAKADFDTSKKRKRQVFSEGPIPGEPVLHKILTSGNETVGYMLLKNLGIKDKVKQQQDEQASTEGKIYGCHIPKSYEISQNIHHKIYEICEIYKEFLSKPKDNTFGLGYVGLDKNHLSLFPTQSSSKFVVTDKNKKMSITGQAFGVGAFEEEDDDIYVKEDMSKYDFELFNEKQRSRPVKDSKNLIHDMFVNSKVPLLNKKLYPPPKIPHSFTGKYKVRKSRFEPIVEVEEKPNSSRINPTIRARYLGEDTDKEHTKSKSVLGLTKDPKEESKNEDSSEPSNKKNTFDVASLYLNDRFVSSTKNDDVTNILEPVAKMETLHGTEQMRAAVKMKMFGSLTRTTNDWIPCALLCKRFNVPEPFVDCPERTRTRTKNLIFEYQKHQEEETSLKPGLSTEIKESATEIPNVETNENTQELVKSNEENSDSEPVNISTSEIKQETPETSNDAPIDITEKIDVEKQQDLFKAVFLSSDSDSEPEDKPDESTKTNSDRSEELKSAILSDQLIPKIKPLKEGILSAINFHKFSSPSLKKQGSENDGKNLKEDVVDIIVKEEEKEVSSSLYGPKIPDRVGRKESSVNISISSESEDEWVEKDDVKKKKKHKKEKKHKKDKHKKSKHAKKKKNRD